jgi:hypothetical protein
MEKLPNPCFPLLPSDQAEVITIFNELMRHSREPVPAADAPPPLPPSPPSDSREPELQ